MIGPTLSVHEFISNSVFHNCNTRFINKHLLVADPKAVDTYGQGVRAR